mgnify:CR=1 FL=1
MAVKQAEKTERTAAPGKRKTKKGLTPSGINPFHFYVGNLET